jgi:hypothetical protein
MKRAPGLKGLEMIPVKPPRPPRPPEDFLVQNTLAGGAENVHDHQPRPTSSRLLEAAATTPKKSAGGLGGLAALAV